MPAQTTRNILFNSPEETDQFATQLGQRLERSDSLLLSGPVGAGKTHFARALILSLLDVPEDVPSPTFTLVQSYENAAGSIWHADLYRLSSTHEVEELGLLEAFETAICLIEWPDRLGDLAPQNALSLVFQDGAHDLQRRVTATWSDEKWIQKWPMQ